MYEDLTPELALQNAPSEKARALMRKQFIASGVLKDGMTNAERVQLAQFQNQVAGDAVTARHNQAHGGQAAMEQKDRVSNAWLSNNVHSQK